MIDTENGSTAALIEAERRFGSYIFLELEGRFTLNVDERDALFPADRDDALTLRLTRHF